MSTITCGRHPAKARSIYRLALRIADYAKSIGLQLRILRRSRSAGSKSCYLTFFDSDGLRWIIRVSDHELTRKVPESAHHINFVAKDGATGFDRVVSALHRIVQGDLEWHDPYPVDMPGPEPEADE